MMRVLKVFLAFIFTVVLVVQLDAVTSSFHNRQRQKLAKDGFDPFLSFGHMRSAKRHSPTGSFKLKPRLPVSAPSAAVLPASYLQSDAMDSGETTSVSEYETSSDTPKRPKSPQRLVTYPPAGPPLIDWRSDPSYPKVRNQNKFGCTGACWAFSSVSVLEILYSRRHQKETHFSYQQMIDCCRTCAGCYGGSTLEALHYLVENGVTFEENYPFKGVDGDCRSDIEIAAKARTFRKIERGDEFIVQALRHSPLAVNIHFPTEIKMYYEEGVAFPDCDDHEDLRDHSVVIVGHGEGYWIIRNSWGEEFGEKGHYLLKKGTCGVGLEVWSVTLDDPTQDQKHISKKAKMLLNGITRIVETFRSFRKFGICL